MGVCTTPVVKADEFNASSRSADDFHRWLTFGCLQRMAISGAYRYAICCPAATFTPFTSALTLSMSLWNYKCALGKNPSCFNDAARLINSDWSAMVTRSYSSSRRTECCCGPHRSDPATFSKGKALSELSSGFFSMRPVCYCLSAVTRICFQSASGLLFRCW